MKKNLSFVFPTLALASLLVFFVPSSLVFAGFCATPLAESVTTSVSTDTLSAASGTELLFHVSLTNAGGADLNGGSISIAITREPKAGDFSQGSEFLVARSVVKTNVVLGARATENLSFAWNIPAGLPSGVYRADAYFSEGGRVFGNGTISTKTPFGNSAKVLISGEATGVPFFIAGNSDNDEPSIAFVNASGKDLTLPVTIKTYAGGLAGALISSKSVMVSAKNGSTAVVDYASPTPVQAFGVTAETAYNDIPAVYAFLSPNVQSTCFDLSMFYPWAMLIGGIGSIISILSNSKRKRNRLNVQPPQPPQPFQPPQL